MEGTRKCKNVVFSTFLWIIVFILLCTGANAWALDIPDDGIIYSIPGDFGPVLNETVWVYGTVNIGPGAVIHGDIIATDDSTVNITGGTVDWWVDVAPLANVTVYGTDFEIDGVAQPQGDVTINGTLTVNTGSSTEFSMDFECFSDSTVTLATPGGSEEPIPVDIDIKPGSYPNSINLGSNGVVPVAILRSETFDATTIDPTTVELAGSGVAVRGKGKSLAHEEDVNGDGLVDLVVQVETENLDPGEFQDGFAILTGETLDGVIFEGSDEITIVPPE